MPLAHAGHWLTSLLYLAPVLAVALGIGWTKLQDRRHGADRDVEDLSREPTLDDIMDGRA